MGIGISTITTLRGNKGGLYYVRLIGNDIWWYAEDQHQQWAHVFKGIFQKKNQTIEGEWVDVPKHPSSNYGKVELTIINPTIAQVTAQTGGFVDSELKYFGPTPSPP